MLDVYFPPNLPKNFKGPKFRVPVLRELTGVKCTEDQIPAVSESFARARATMKRFEARGLPPVAEVVPCGGGTDTVRLLRELLMGGALGTHTAVSSPPR
jgi:hypothetical protein